MEKKELGIKLPKITADDFFTTQEERDSVNLEKVKNISIREIYNFPNHPFKVKEDEEMNKLKESILEKGVVSPAIIRPRKTGGYEMIAGHRRKKASELARLKEIPCIIRDLTDDEAIVIMVESNIQREEILPSEKAFAYKMRNQALNHQGKRTDLTLSQVENKLENKTSIEIVCEESGDTKDTIYRYIRLTELLPEILEMVDDKRVAFTPAVEISYLTKEEQKILLDCMDYLDLTPSHAQAIRLKKLSKSGELNADKIDDILSEEKPNQIERIKINRNKLKDYIPSNLISEKEIEEYIIQCIKEQYKRNKQKGRDER